MKGPLCVPDATQRAPGKTSSRHGQRPSTSNIRFSG